MPGLAIRFLTDSLSQSTKSGHIAAVPFVWLRLLDQLCDDRGALDASVGLFIFGRNLGQPIEIDRLLAYINRQPALKCAVKKLSLPSRTLSCSGPKTMK